MSVSRSEITELAKQVASKMGIKTGRKARGLALVQDGIQAGMNAMQRDVVYSRIRDLGNLYWLNWLIRQETMHVLGVMECLTDDELTALLVKVERGVEARMDGVAFEDVGLVRGATNNWVA